MKNIAIKKVHLLRFSVALLTVLAISIISQLQGQSNLPFIENFSHPTGQLPPSNWSSPYEAHIFIDDESQYSGNNLLMQNCTPPGQTRFVVVQGINTTGWQNINLSFVYRRSNAFNPTVLLYWSIDGTSWGTNFAILEASSYSGGNWFQFSIILPTGCNNLPELWIKYEYTTNTTLNCTTPPNFRIDNFVVTSSTPLPVELVNFNGKKIANKIALSWQTASELNSSHFSIEKSTDGSNFREIGIVPGSGTTTEPHDYEFIDESPSPGTNYYRLRQEDFDGRFEYSKVVSVNFDDGGSVQLYPTIVNDEVNLRFNKPTEEAGRLLVFDTGGRLVHQQRMEPETELLSFSTENMMPGHYLARVQFGRTMENLRFVKQ
jgi:hypothetical protein